MKTKIKRHSRSVLAVVLTLCMLVSCMTVGLIATDAARVTDSGAVAAQADSDSVGDGQVTLYVLPADTWLTNKYKIQVNTNSSYNNDNYSSWWHLDEMSVSGLTKNGKPIFKITLDDRACYDIQISAYDSSNNHQGDWSLYSGGTTKNLSDYNNKVITGASSSTDFASYTFDTYSLHNGTISSGSSLGSFVWDNSAEKYALTVSLTGGTTYKLCVYNADYGTGSKYFQCSATTMTATDNKDMYAYNTASDSAVITIVPGTTANYTFEWTMDSNERNSNDAKYLKYGNLAVTFPSGSDASTFSLTGNIDSTYIASINGVANSLARGTSLDSEWWKAYHSEAAINQPGSSANVYSITFTTVDAATLKANNHSVIDIGLSTTAGVQKAFQIGGTYYNYIGADYKVTSAGVTDQNIVDLAATNGGGSLVVQPGRTYTLTVNETNNTFSIKCTSSDKYFLAGQYNDGSVQFFESSWNTSNNELVFNSSTGCYEKKFSTAEGSQIAAGTINFKVVENGDSDGWNGGSYPSGNTNQTYVINANPTSVTFSFNPSTGKTTVTQENDGSGDTLTGWLYSGTAPASRTEVDPTSGMSTFDASKEQDGEYGKFRFMYNTTDPGLNNVKIPEYYKTGTGSNAYWAELTSSMTQNSNFYFCLSNYWSVSNIVGNGSEEINDSTSDKTIQDKDGNTLFRIQRRQNGSIHNDVKYILIYDVDWTKVSAIGVRAYDNSKATNNSNPRNNKVDYQIFYKAKAVTPVAEAKVVDIYAKNGTLRDSTFNRFTNLADTNIEDYFYYEETVNDVTTEYTSVADYNAAHAGKEIVVTHNVAYGNSSYDKMTNVPVGAKIKLKTTLSSNASDAGSFNNQAFKDTHYLKAYSFNGMTYELHEANSTGVYEETWTVRAVNTTYHDANDILQNAMSEGKAVEVTPIYYMQDTTNTKTFYIDGYDGEVQNAWGNMLAVYPYYEGVSNSGNAFGGYPGQPMLLWGGKYQMEIPLTVDGTANGASVKGLTLHNGFWDLLHRSLDIRCNDRNHAQTYDYDDFYKLYKEYDPDTIIFDFKYRTKTDNYNDGDNYTNYSFAGTDAKSAADFASQNGVEIVTDYFGRQVDAFGTLITDNNQSDYDSEHSQDKELLFVSTGYKDTYVGEYATLWAVYAPQSSIPSGSGDTAGKFIGYISSSMLYLKNWDRRLQYTGGDSTANGRMSWSAFEATYKHLKDYYNGVPALISYEKEIWNNSKDKANRSDGKWYYSNKSDKISASIKIQYGSYKLLDAPDHSVSSTAWNDDPFDDTLSGVGGYHNIGSTTNCAAYFTNTTPNLKGKVESGEQFADSTKKFTFQADASGAYMFAGWVRYSNGKYYEITENDIGESPMSANDVYIARFVDSQTGSLTIQHVVEQTNVYTGTGTPGVSVVVKNNGTPVLGSPFTSNDGSKIDISKWIDSRYANYTIDITLTTTPTNESFMKEMLTTSGNFAPLKNTWNENYTAENSAGANTDAQTTTVAQFTVKDILDSGITTLRYTSHLMKPHYTYKYEIVYTYTSRFWGEQSYTQTGTFETDNDFAAHTTGATTTAKLNTDFIINKTPYEKNFRQQINWNYTNVQVGTAAAMVNNAAVLESSNTYIMRAQVNASNVVNDRVTAEFVLPYKYDTKANGYAALQGDMYQTAEQEHNVDLQHTYIYDTSYESFKLTTQAYKLFTYDDAFHSGSDGTLASGLPLIEAAPYVIKNSGYHYYYTTKERYFSSSDKDVENAQSFEINGTKYWLNEVPEGKTGTAVTENTKATFNGTEYSYAILINHGTASVYDDELYRFVNVDQDNVQYTYTSWVRTIDGILYNSGGSKLFFTRWDIFNTKGDYVASCYNRRFTYSGYDNYVIRPVYESDEENAYASSLGTGFKSSITYLDDSRNQWNNNGGGNYASVTKQDALEAADKIFADFAITYNYNGQNLNTIPSLTADSTNGANIRVGMVIERLDELDTIGTNRITDASYYAYKYKDDNDWQALATALAEGETGLTTAVRTKGGDASKNHNCYLSRIASNYGEDKYTEFNSPAPGHVDGQDTVVDNFNRLQWFYTFNNSTKKANASESTTTMKDYAYRAISYMIVTDSTGNRAYLTDTPAYFTIYDTATRAHN